MAPGAPYHHFQDKEALLEALAVEGFDGLGEALAAATAGEGDAQRRLSRMIEAYLRFSLDHGEHYRLMFPKNATGAAWEQAATGAFQRLALALAAVRTELAPEEVMGVATTVWALCHGAVMLRLDGLLRERGPVPDLEELLGWTVAAAEAIANAAPQPLCTTRR